MGGLLRGDEPVDRFTGRRSVSRATKTNAIRRTSCRPVVGSDAHEKVVFSAGDTTMDSAAPVPRKLRTRGERSIAAPRTSLHVG
jgi:hypothetical protein